MLGWWLHALLDNSSPSPSLYSFGMGYRGLLHFANEIWFRQFADLWPETLAIHFAKWSYKLFVILNSYFLFSLYFSFLFFYFLFLVYLLVVRWGNDIFKNGWLVSKRDIMSSHIH